MAHGIDASLIIRLCGHGATNMTITTHGGFAGFFSQLNTLAQSLLDQLLASDDAGLGSTLYEIYDAPIFGYGGGTLSQFFEPAFSCSAPPLAAQPPLRVFPRYLLVSHLLHLVFKPRRLMTRKSQQQQHVEVAVHARRTDKLVARGAERIAIPNEEQLVALVMECIRDLRAQKLAERSALLASLPAPVAPGVAYSRLSPSLATMLNRSVRVLIASDDSAFANSLAASLRAARYGQEPIEVSIEPARAATSSATPTDGPPPTAREHASCDASCVPPLLATLEAFARAASLVLSTGSNMGAFLLASWPAHNGDRVPFFVDTDQRVTPADLGGVASSKPASQHADVAASSSRASEQQQEQRGVWNRPGERFFCRLELGSRAGLCNGTERWNASSCSSFCLATLRGEACKDCLVMRRGRGVS